MDLLHRIRWANVARAAALVAAVLLLVSWPRLRAEPPPLPPQPEVVEEQAPVPAGEVALDGADRAGVAPAESREGWEARERAEGRERPERVVRRERAERRARAERRERAERRGRAKRRASARRRRAAGARSAMSAVRAPRVAAPPAPIAAPRVWTPPRTEFGFEGR